MIVREIPNLILIFLVVNITYKNIKMYLRKFWLFSCLVLLNLFKYLVEEKNKIVNLKILSNN